MAIPLKVKNRAQLKLAQRALARAMRKVRGGPGIHVTDNDSGVTVSLISPPPSSSSYQILEMFPAKLVDKSGNAGTSPVEAYFDVSNKSTYWRWVYADPAPVGLELTYAGEDDAPAAAMSSPEKDGHTWARPIDSWIPTASHGHGMLKVPLGTMVIMMKLRMITSGAIIYGFMWSSGLAVDPVNLGVSGEGSSDDALEEVWDINDPPANKSGVSVTVLTRVRYDHEAGSPTLYGYQRTKKYDSQGRLIYVSEETRYTIDVPEAC